MANITLVRSGVMVNFAGKSGELGELTVCGVKFQALERRDGFVALDDGTYDVVMEISPSVGRRQFRVLGHNKLGGMAAILIHSANHPGDLQGCIAPGLSLIDGGVGESDAAMTQIFSLLGGFKIGTTASLFVTHRTNPAFDERNDYREPRLRGI